MKKQKRVLVTILNWGLGHATRCIPIIKKLQEYGLEVVLASDGRSARLLKKECPNLELIEFPSYNIRYSTNNMVLNIAYQIPKILMTIWKENQFVQKLVEKEQIDIIISDNRYGCKSKSTKNIFITHQLNIIVPFKPLERLVNKINHFLINRFDECWVPDFEGEKSLAGKLSKRGKIKNVKYLGPLSRLEIVNADPKYDIIAVISGPEPQRTKFEKGIIGELKSTQLKSLVVQGKANEMNQFQLSKKIEVVSFLDSSQLSKAIQSSEIVICRSGYSSIMDLIKLKKKAILVPTPGQTEQEYLALRLQEKRQFCVQQQATFTLKKGLKEIENYSANLGLADGFNPINEVISSLVNQKFKKHLA